MPDLIGETFPVLDKGFVELVDVMGDDYDIVAAARASYRSQSKGAAADKKLLFYLMEHRHTTPFEMAELKFRIKAPVLVTQQWFRHRTWSYNSASLRYTEAEEDDFYVPDVWRTQSTQNKQGSSGILDDERNTIVRDGLIDAIKNSYEMYKLTLETGVTREQARLFLPGFAFYYTFIAKTDVHNLMHFLKLRMGEHAQWEIKQYANTIYHKIFKPLYPWTAEAFEKFLIKE